MITTANKVRYLTDPYEIMAWWPLFDEGRQSLCKHNARSQTPEDFFLMLLKIVQLGEKGVLAVMTSKNDKPLAFACALESENFAGDRFMFVWSLYTNQKCKTAVEELVQFAKHWARSRDLGSIKMSSQRLSGAADRFWRSHGFRLEYKSFTLSL